MNAQNWTRAERLVAAEIAAAVRAGRTIAGQKIITSPAFRSKKYAPRFASLQNRASFMTPTGRSVRRSDDSPYPKP
jgi:hypothetical protein